MIYNNICHTNYLDKLIVSNITTGKIIAVRRSIFGDNNKLIEKITEILSEPFEEKVIINKDGISPDLLIINVTNACNLKCNYCYVNANSDANIIKSDCIIEIISKFAKKDITVLFQGGEPLLAFNEIKEAVSKLKLSNIHYQIQTNGTLINEEMIEFFEKYNFRVSISLDGFDKIENANRNSNKINIIDNFVKIKDKIKEQKISCGVLSVITVNNVHNLVKNATKLIESGIDSFAFNLLWPIRDTSTNLDKQIVDNDDLADKMIELFKYLYKLNIENNYAAFQKYRERNIFKLYQRLLYMKYDNFMCMKSPCGAGTETVTFDCNGNIYPCTYYSPPIRNDLSLGNVYTNNKIEILEKRKKQQLRNISHIPKCQRCLYNKVCGGGGCSGAILQCTGQINGDSIYCEYYFKFLTKMIDWLMNFNNLDVLKNF